MEKIRFAAACILLLSTMVLQGCSGNGHGLNSDRPIMPTLWHYYNGSQKQASDRLVDEFNETQRKGQGISVNTVIRGDISNISVDLKSSLEKKVSIPELPNIFAAHGDTAENVEKAEELVSISDYMSNKEVAEYVNDHMKDGSLHDHAYVNISPIAKATEVMVINKDIQDGSTKRENVKLPGLDTWEGLARVGERYYTYSGGKAFFARDIPMNYLNTGNGQLSTPLSSITGHTGSFTVSRETMRKLWDQYYVLFVKGYHAKNGRFASNDMKAKDVVTCISPSAGVTFFPKEIIRDDGTGYAVEYVVRGIPDFEGKESYAITQGTGMAVSKSNKACGYASVQFLKWFTEKERSILFFVGSSYLPVKKEANSFAPWSTITGTEKVTVNRPVRDIVKTSMKTVSTGILTSQKSFNGSYEVRNYLETALNEKCAADARQIQQTVKNKDSREKAWKPYLSNENFNTWFEQITEDINEKMKDSNAQCGRIPRLAGC